MNFLSHFYFEDQPSDSYLVAGLAIPDLVRHFSKPYNATLKHAVMPEHNLLSAIHQGIIRHYDADKHFHTSPVFQQHCKLLLQLFLNEGLDRQKLRLSVIAHLAIELLLDGCIVKYRADVATHYYEHLHRVDTQVLKIYFDYFGLDMEKQHFLFRFQSFMQRKFIFLLSDVGNVVLGLGRIYESVTAHQFTDSEKKKLAAAMHNMEPHLRYSWQQLLKK